MRHIVERLWDGARLLLILAVLMGVGMGSRLACERAGAPRRDNVIVAGWHLRDCRPCREAGVTAEWLASPAGRCAEQPQPQ